LVQNTDARWWISNHSIEAIQISHLVGFAGLADLMMCEAEAVQYGADIERDRYPCYPDDWDFLVGLGRQGRYATYVCDDNGDRDLDDRHIFYRLHAIHDAKEVCTCRDAAPLGIVVMDSGDQ